MKVLRNMLAMACLPLWSALRAQTTVALTPRDLDSAEWYYTNSFASGNRTLYEMGVDFPDAARGYYTGTRGEAKPSARPTLDKSDYCYSSLIAIARETASTTMLSPDKRGIFTASQFTIEKIVKKDGHHKAGDTVTLIQFGGTYRDDAGTLLRVQTAVVPFLPSHSYLLVMDKARTHPSTSFFSFVPPIEVVNGHVFLVRGSVNPGAPGPIATGEPFDTFWVSYNKDFYARGCSDREPINDFYPFPLP